jgi:hypothetical protein
VVLGRTAGFVAASGSVVCSSCGTDAELLRVFRIGPLDGPILHPAPDGRYAPTKESKHYDEPCCICGWAIR